MGGTAGRLRPVRVPQRTSLSFAVNVIPPFYLHVSPSAGPANDTKDDTLSLPTLISSYGYLYFVSYYMSVFMTAGWLRSCFIYPHLPRPYPCIVAPFIQDFFAISIADIST